MAFCTLLTDIYMNDCGEKVRYRSTNINYGHGSRSRNQIVKGELKQSLKDSHYNSNHGTGLIHNRLATVSIVTVVSDNV